MHFTNARTKREAVVTAIIDFNRRKHMAELIGLPQVSIKIINLLSQRYPLVRMKL